MNTNRHSIGIESDEKYFNIAVARIGTIQEGYEMSKSKQAVAWMVARSGRTQQEAAARFGISQSAVSQAMRIYVREGMRPDARRQ